MPPPRDFQPLLFYQNLRIMSKFAHLLIQPDFLFAAQTDFPRAGIVSSLALYPRPKRHGALRLLSSKTLEAIPWRTGNQWDPRAKK